MDAPFGQCSLYLCPVQHDFKIKESSTFIDTLQSIGFISQKIETQSAENSYLTGPRFLEYITYIGCSPAIQFEPTKDNKNFCHVNIKQHESPRLVVSNKQSRDPHCPNCTGTVKNWHDEKTDTTILCELCHTRSNIEAFNWRKMAGYSRLFIEITDIFPKEAIPQKLLLDELTQHLGTEWQYFYSCK